MKTNQIVKIFLGTIGVLGGVAFSDIHFPVEFGLEAPKRKLPIEFAASLGYTTKHVSRDMAFEDSGSDNAIPMEITGAYKLGKNDAIVAGVRYVWLTENGLDHDKVGICDEGSAILGWKHAWKDNLHTTLSYQFEHGNIGGSFNIHEQGSHKNRFAFDHVMPEEHSVVLDTYYGFGDDIGMKGVFLKSRVQYAFQWMTGWWFQTQLGYKYDWNDKVSTIIYGSWNVTAGYFEAASRNTNGSQGFSINLEVPYKYRENITIAPFIQCVWAGNGAMAANHSDGRVSWNHPEENRFRNFTVAAGVGLRYSF